MVALLKALTSYLEPLLPKGVFRWSLKLANLANLVVADTIRGIWLKDPIIWNDRCRTGWLLLNGWRLEWSWWFDRSLMDAIMVNRVNFIRIFHCERVSSVDLWSLWTLPNLVVLGATQGLWMVCESRSTMKIWWKYSPRNNKVRTVLLIREYTNYRQTSLLQPNLRIRRTK